jgi:riboflavin synthase
MFTGIISEMGTITRATRRGREWDVRVKAPRASRGLKVGGSVAVDGVCLTATRVGRSSFDTHVVAETARRSTLGRPVTGQRVNLERPLTPRCELGGHFVQGHVDASARVAGLQGLPGEALLVVELPHTLRHLVVEKGSIAINGVSLTVAEVTPRRFAVALIPHTLRMTNLGALRAGSRVNLEADILGKYAAALLKRGARKR